MLVTIQIIWGDLYVKIEKVLYFFNNTLCNRFWGVFFNRSRNGDSRKTIFHVCANRSRLRNYIISNNPYGQG